MMSETPNRAAADLLPAGLLAPLAKEALLAQTAPALLLAADGTVLFASHALARRLGHADGAALMAAGLPPLNPGTERLRALAGADDLNQHSERLRFVIGGQQQILALTCAPLRLAEGARAVLVTLGAEGSVGTTAPAQTAPPAPAPAPRPVRFVFSLTPEGWIESLSPAFVAALDVSAEALEGQALSSVAAALDPGAGEAIESAVARGITWGGIRLNWPVPTLGQRVPVVLSAMPRHGEAGLSGFSGFGRCLFDEAEPLSPPRALAAEGPSEDESPATAPAGPAPAAPEAPVAPPSPVEADLIEPAQPEPAEPEACEVEACEVEAAPQAPLAEDTAQAEDTAETRDLAQAIAAFAQDDEEAIEPPAAPEADNVVSLRPGQMELPPGLPPHLTRPGLSMSERNAFREIAQALGAKFDPEAGYEPSARTTPQDGAAPATPPAAGSAPALPPLPAEALAGPAGLDGVLVDHLPVGVLVLRGEETVFANQTLLALAGYPDLADFLVAGGAAALFRKGAPPRGNEDGFDTVVLTTREGEMLPVDAHLQTIRWGGAPASLMAFRRAVELEQGKALKSVAQDLKRAHGEARELRAVLDTATDGVMTLDETGAILSLNHAAEALFGLSQNEVAGSAFVSLLHNDSHAAALDYFEGLKANGVRSVLNDGREVAGRERKGGRIPLFLTLGRVSDEEPRRYCAVLRDLTAWKRAEADLTDARRAAENANANKSDFLAKVGHEIRTPMNAIIGFAELMLEERLGPVNNAKYKEYLGDIRTSGLHVVSLVNDLLDLSKIEAGRMELNFGATDLNAVVAGCVGLIQPQATQLRVLVRSQLAQRLPAVVADERSIRQIVLNLLSNATRFTPAGGQVLVATVLQDNGEAILRIRDTGVGMSAAEIDQALESYRQVGPRRETGGTGLGLPLSRALAEANRASFSIRSAPGEGTTVEISFPPTRVLAE